ncbi:hypothetical protein B0J14DRAFT_687940 [Halenospora varia]|nr:hypothetical protein B0J14DRAFT_687940 [Halenospora varia]
MEDLTRTDIQLYIEDQLVQDQMMQRLSTEEPIACTKLVQEIGEAAQGVFLWVELVVKSLLNGLSNQDRVEHLSKRLKQLPRGLEDLYTHIVTNIDNVYQEEASRLYQLIAVAIEQPGDWKPAETLSVLSVYLAMHEESFLDPKFNTELQDRDIVLLKCKETNVFLKTRCGGLIELQYVPGSTEIVPGKEGFNPTIAIVKALDYQVKMDAFVNQWFYIPPKDQIITYAKRLDSDKKVSEAELIHLFDRLGQALGRESMLPIAVQACMTRYLQAKLRQHNVVTEKKFERPLLEYALVPTSDSERFIRPEVVSILLSFGAKPNQKFDGQSPW